MTVLYDLEFYTMLPTKFNYKVFTTAARLEKERIPRYHHFKYFSKL